MIKIEASAVQHWIQCWVTFWESQQYGWISWTVIPKNSNQPAETWKYQNNHELTYCEQMFWILQCTSCGDVLTIFTTKTKGRETNQHDIGTTENGLIQHHKRMSAWLGIFVTFTVVVGYPSLSIYYFWHKKLAQNATHDVWDFVYYLDSAS